LNKRRAESEALEELVQRVTKVIMKELVQRVTKVIMKLLEDMVKEASRSQCCRRKRPLSLARIWKVLSNMPDRQTKKHKKELN